MSDINVDMRKVRSLNQNLYSMERQIEYAQRGISRIAAEIPDEILARQQIRERLKEVSRETERLIVQLEELRDVTNSCMDQYAEAENKNSRNAAVFD